MEPALEALWRRLVARTDYERCARPRAARFELGAMRTLLQRLGEPQRAFGSVHVAGSKGKGTTAHFLERGWRAAGLRTGLYTSPHLTDWRERVRVAGDPAPDDALTAALAAVLDAADDLPDATFFDLLTATAFVVFRDAGVEAAAVEVGLGGRSDSTNVLEPWACVVTSIELEHTDVLGPTLAAVAGEKAGIFRPDVPAWLGADLPSEARAVLEAEAVRVGAPVRTPPPGASPPRGLADHPLAHVRRLGALARAVLADLPEPYRRGAVALDALDAAELALPGRFEAFHVGGRVVVLDVAHSPNSLGAVTAAFRAAFPERRALLLAARDDRDPAALAAALGPRAADELRFACPAGDHPRSADPVRLAAAFGAETLAAAPTTADRLAAVAPGLPLLVTGSTYHVGALRPALLAHGDRIAPPRPRAAARP